MLSNKSGISANRAVKRQPASPSDLEAAAKAKSDTERYEELAKAHESDLSEQGFNEALRKVGRAKS